MEETVEEVKKKRFYNYMIYLKKLERETGFEPATLALASRKNPLPSPATP